MRPNVLLSWSSGKDSAWALHVLRQRGEVEVVGLVTTFNEAFGRVAMHGVRLELVQAQAEAAGLPLWSVPLPWPCSNDEYETRMRQLIERAQSAGVTAFAFGDLFLEDIRAYRERQLAGTGIEPLFPLWGTADETPTLARAMIAGGLRATLACVDPRHLTSSFAGRAFDTELLADLPYGVDPCGERGEFHTFCHAGPMFQRSIPVRVGEVVERDGFVFADLLPTGGKNP
ncbi:MAG: ATP-binding protein [Gemmataceae bacterium]